MLRARDKHVFSVKMHWFCLKNVLELNFVREETHWESPITH